MKMPGNMQNMMKQAQQMQEKLQAEVAQIRVEGSAGGGMVTVKMDGHKNVLGTKIDPEAAGDVEMLQDMDRGLQRSGAQGRRRKPEKDERHVGGPGPSAGPVLTHA